MFTEMHIIIADGNPIPRTALRLALEQHQAYRVTAEVGDAIHLLAYAVRDFPDLVILDPDLPGITPGKLYGPDSLAEVIGLLGWFCPRARRVAFCNRSDQREWCKNGIFDCRFSKGDSPDALMSWLDSEFLPVETKPRINVESWTPLC